MTSQTKFYGFTPYLVYDGTNGAELVSSFNTGSYAFWTIGCVASLTSESGGTAVVHFTNIDGGGTIDLTLIAGKCIPINNSPAVMSVATLNLQATALGPIASSVRYGGYGESLLGALTVGNTNIAVTIKPAQPDTGYVATAFLDGPTLALGTVSLGTPVKTSASVVTVPVINSGLLTLTLSQATVTVNVTAPQS